MGVLWRNCFSKHILIKLLCFFEVKPIFTYLDMPPKNDQGNAASKDGGDRSVAGKNMPSKNEGKDSGPGRDNLPPKKWIEYPKDHSYPDDP